MNAISLPPCKECWYSAMDLLFSHSLRNKEAGDVNLNALGCYPPCAWGPMVWMLSSGSAKAAPHPTHTMEARSIQLLGWEKPHGTWTASFVESNAQTCRQGGGKQPNRMLLQVSHSGAQFPLCDHQIELRGFSGKPAFQTCSIMGITKVNKNLV